MTELKSFAALQARVYEFLGQQDETTLRAIVDGTAMLSVLPGDDARAPVDSAPRDDMPAALPEPTNVTTTPSSDPDQAAQDLSTLASEQERRIYLNAAELLVPGLRQVAKLRGLKRYSNLDRASLVNLLASGSSNVQQPTTTEKIRPSAEPPPPNAAISAIVSRLREAETDEEGAAYLHSQHLDRKGLLAVAAELQLTRVSRLSQTELEKKVLKQAISARRKFAGLRKW